MRVTFNRLHVGRSFVGAAAVMATFASPAWAAERYAALVIDAHSKSVLHADMADEERYPASLTKMMTLYLLFESIDRGEVSLTDRMTVSRRASAQPPTKLGLRPGEKITVEDALKALITKSANDAAVVIAEHLAGSEARFAARMTARARELGMSKTRFMNASGLPDARQVTTARDIAALSQALIEDYPQFYGYFQTPGMKWRRAYARNHNRLLGVVEGVDGIKTGYTQASGFNLASSAMRDGQRIIAVVLGGETALSRDNQMRHLIDDAFMKLSLQASNVEQAGPGAPVTLTSAPMTRAGVEAVTGLSRIERVAVDRPSFTAPAPAAADADPLARISEVLERSRAEPLR